MWFVSHNLATSFPFYKKEKVAMFLVGWELSVAAAATTSVLNISNLSWLSLYTIPSRQILFPYCSWGREEVAWWICWEVHIFLITFPVENYAQMWQFSSDVPILGSRSFQGQVIDLGMIFREKPAEAKPFLSHAPPWSDKTPINRISILSELSFSLLALTPSIIESKPWFSTSTSSLQSDEKEN